MNTRPFLSFHVMLWLVLPALITLVCLPSHSLANDESHGGPADNAPDSADTFEPGAAVKAPRTTERYTEKGMTQNPVAFDIDPQGNLYVAEGWRAGVAVLDNRNGPLRKSGGVEDDLRKQTVEDRADQIKRLIEGGFYPAERFTDTADKVRFLRDTNGDGKADESKVFSDGYNDPLDGIASGVLYHDGKLYFTNIPHLWLLEDKDGDGDADKTTEGECISLSYGWGVRWTFYGHDMHGLIKGPDGRIYFSIGDRGYNVTTKEGKQIIGPDRGAVFRMWPDGSGLELYFEGLRNPQELAFDNYGNLFTGDNNSDSGDKARFVYLPEGGDSGWRQDVQSLRDRGPWNREHMWKPRFEKNDPAQPAWIIPPLANVGRGPSGLAHYPGTGDVFPANGSFLMCDYPAGVRHVYVQPDGATFKVVEDSKLPTDGQSITDVAWGYDGRLYLSDWGGGWRPNPNGYIKTMTNPAVHADQGEQIAEVKQLFAEGFETLSDEKLIELLGHADQRVRIHAQWELAKDDRRVEEALYKISMNNESSDLMRLHALWTAVMKARSENAINETIDVVIPQSLGDPNEQIRAQAVKALGELGIDSGFWGMLNDPSPIVRYELAIAIARTGGTKSIPILLDTLYNNDNNDVAIRHAASYGLSLIGDAKAIHAHAHDSGTAERLGAVLALRRLDSPLLGEYLDDEDVQVAAEAARAIYDKRVTDAMPALAELLDTLPAEQMIEPIMRRAIEANVRLSNRAGAERLARLAANLDAPDAWRELALKELDDWGKQRNREGVWGSWWPRDAQPMDDAVIATLAVLPRILQADNAKLRDSARSIVLGNMNDNELAALAANPEESPSLRAIALRVLAAKDPERATEAMKAVLADADAPAELRMPVRDMLLPLDKDAAVASYLDAYTKGEIAERQDAIDRLAEIDHPDALALLTRLAPALATGDIDPALRLDVYEAIRGNERLPVAVRGSALQYEQAHAKPGEEPFIRDAVLAGGSIQAGLEVYRNHPAAQCMRCHGQGTIGPDLAGIGSRFDIDYLYTSLVKPHADIAEGYAATTARLKDGTMQTGRLDRERSTPAQLVLINEQGEAIEIQRSNLQGMPVTSDQSQMPTMTDKLSPSELRDVLAYLVSLKGDGTAPTRLAAGLASTGPIIQNPAKDMPHHVWLPVILMGIFVSLGLLLLATVLGGGPTQG